MNHYSILLERYNITAGFRFSMFVCLFQERKQTSDRNVILGCEPFCKQHERDNLKTRIENLFRFSLNAELDVPLKLF